MIDQVRLKPTEYRSGKTQPTMQPVQQNRIAYEMHPWMICSRSQVIQKSSLSVVNGSLDMNKIIGEISVCSSHKAITQLHKIRNIAQEPYGQLMFAW